MAENRCSGLKSWAAGVWHSAHRKKQIVGDGMKTDLRRCLGTADLVLIGLGHMMGAGVYVITGNVMVNDAGASTVLSYVMAGVASLLGGLCYAQFSVNIPKTGTAYNYVYFIFGEIWGFLAGWNIILEYLILVASVGRSFSAYIDNLSGGVILNGTLAVFGDFDSDVFGPVDPLGGALIVLFFMVVAIGVRTSVNVNNVMTVLNVAVLILIAIASFAIGSVENFDDDHGGFFPKGFGGTMKATGIVFFAYVGFDAIAVAAEETKNPSRSMPIAIILAILIVTALYCSAALALALLLPYYEINEDVPFPDAFRRHGIQWIAYTVSVGAIFGMVASLLGQAFCLPRGIYAIAKDGLLFAPFTYVNSWTQTPLVAVAISTILAALLAIFITVSELVQMVSIGTLFAMTLMTASLLKLHYIPGPYCPFELKITGGSDETTPANPKSQSFHAIGKLRFDLPFLNRMDASKVTSIVIGLLLCGTTGLTAVCVRGSLLIAQGSWIMIVLLVVFIIIFIGCTGILLMYEHNTSFTKFSVPLVPWMPILTLFVNLTLMMTLSTATWIRLFVWIVIGLLLYFGYGIRHSLADRDDYIEMTDDISPISDGKHHTDTDGQSHPSS